MNRYVHDEYYRLPDLHARLDIAARRERARVIAAGFAWLLKYAKTHLVPRFSSGRAHWIERLG